MSILYILLAILYILACGALVVVILMQKKRSAGLGGMTGMGGAPTYWDKNKGRSLEGSLEKYTKIIAAVLAVFTVIMCVIR